MPFKKGVKISCSKIHSRKTKYGKKNKLKTSSNGLTHGILTKNVIEANKQVELLSLKQFDLWHDISVPGETKYNVICHHAATLKSSLKMWTFMICKKNMKEMYKNSSVGWNDEKKQKEMAEKPARYLIVQDAISTLPVAFSHFRFDMDYGEEVLYCYELHVEEKVQGLGIGKFLLELLELLALTYKMSKVILTVFKANTIAIGFYNKFGYDVDETSPVDDADETFDYLILSKYLQEKSCG